VIDPRLRLAIDASVGWYEDVATAHGIGCEVADGIWSMSGPAPAFHSALITLEPDVTADGLRERIVDLAWGGLKDTFATVDASTLGMRLLFEASWIHLAPPTDDGAPDPWVDVVLPDDLARWNEHAEMSGVLLPALLDRPGFRFLEQTAGGTTAGAVLRADERAVGLSNVHAEAGLSVDWSTLARAAARRFPGRPVVGFESGADLASAVAAGWDAVGPVRIWAP
jgi:hypothetical protein